MSVMLEMHANSKIDEFGVEDEGGRMMKNILMKKKDLVLVNTTNKTKGKITRQRTVGNKVERSTLDYLIVSKDLFEDLTHMRIGKVKGVEFENINKFNNTKTKATKSDHIMPSSRSKKQFDQIKESNFFTLKTPKESPGSQKMPKRTQDMKK